jgi:hypothetical protein
VAVLTATVLRAATMTDEAMKEFLKVCVEES